MLELYPEIQANPEKTNADCIICGPGLGYYEAIIWPHELRSLGVLTTGNDAGTTIHPTRPEEP